MIKITYSNQAQKFLDRQNKLVRERIIDAIIKLPSGDVKKMQGIKLRRLRVGVFRIIFDMHDKEIFIDRIGLRGSIYKGGR